MYKYLVTLVMMLVFCSTSYMSVSALVSAFSANIPLMIILGAGIELGKVMLVINLHRKWESMSFSFRCFTGLVITVLLLITTFEVYGYLSLNHRVSISDNTGFASSDLALEREAELLKGQIRVIDETLAELPAGYVTRKLKEREKAGYQIKQDRLLSIAQERRIIAGKLHEGTDQAGPMLAVAELFNVSVTRIASVFILVLVGILEPLSVGLTVAVSAAWNNEQAQPLSSEEKLIFPNEPKDYQKDIACSDDETEPGQEDTSESNSETTELLDGSNRSRFLTMVSKHRLTANDIAKLTGRKKIATVKGWLNRDGPKIPDKAFRCVTRRVEKLQGIN